MELLASVAAYAGLATLVVSGFAHGVRAHDLRRALRGHSVWPRALEHVVASGVIAVEVAIGILGIAAATLSATTALRALLLAAFFVFAAYALYTDYLRRHRPEVPCGCSPGEHPVNVWVPVRALAFAVAALAAAVAPEDVLPLVRLTEEVALTMLASFSLGLILWSLPGALHDSATAERRVLELQGGRE